MSKNVYHLLRRKPALYKWQMTREQERLVEELLAYGRLRIDATPKSNFVKLTLVEFDITLRYSNRELRDPRLLTLTKRELSSVLGRRYNGDLLARQVAEKMGILEREASKNIAIEPELERKIARILVQCVHPVVLKMIIYERVEILVTYEWDIGGMMDVPTWQVAGRNSGMQSTDGRQAQIFVSAGGDPFGKAKPGAIFGDGSPALARMVVIAAQELGHYSDIKRGSRGEQYDRYSANFGGTRAKPDVAEARKEDLRQVERIKSQLERMGYLRLAELERVVSYYRKFKRSWFVRLWHYSKFSRAKAKFLHQCKKQKLNFVFYIEPVEFIATRLKMMVDDMLFNLAPEADVYRHPDKRVEEAIACIEALARVPQQVKKWGASACRAFMPNLYNKYYGEVIPGCIEAYYSMTGEKFVLTATRQRSYWLYFILWQIKRPLLWWREYKERKANEENQFEK